MSISEHLFSVVTTSLLFLKSLSTQVMCSYSSCSGQNFWSYILLFLSYSISSSQSMYVLCNMYIHILTLEYIRNLTTLTTIILFQTNYHLSLGLLQQPPNKPLCSDLHPFRLFSIQWPECPFKCLSDNVTLLLQTLYGFPTHSKSRATFLKCPTSFLAI